MPYLDSNTPKIFIPQSEEKLYLFSGEQQV